MTRFTETRTVAQGNGQLSVMTRPTFPLDVLVASAGNALTTARSDLTKTLAALARDNARDALKDLAERFFLTGKNGPSQGDLVRIKTILRMTSTGLAGDVTLKTGNNIKKDSDGHAHGVVRRVQDKPLINEAVPQCAHETQ